MNLIFSTLAVLFVLKMDLSATSSPAHLDLDLSAIESSVLDISEVDVKSTTEPGPSTSTPVKKGEAKNDDELKKSVFIYLPSYLFCFY